MEVTINWDTACEDAQDLIELANYKAAFKALRNIRGDLLNLRRNIMSNGDQDSEDEESSNELIQVVDGYIEDMLINSSIDGLY